MIYDPSKVGLDGYWFPGYGHEHIYYPPKPRRDSMIWNRSR